MRRDELEELQFITPIENLPSIVEHGILAHNLVDSVTSGEHASVAMSEVQERRAEKRLPDGSKLHDYANLYVCARNPMMYKRQDEHDHLSVVRVSTDVLDGDGVVVSDGNAAASEDYVAFRAGAEGLAIVDKDLTFAEYWTDQDYFEYRRKSRAKCAEVLVPERVDPGFLIGVRVMDEEVKKKVEDMDLGLEVVVDPHLFFKRS